MTAYGRVLVVMAQGGDEGAVQVAEDDVEEQLEQAGIAAKTDLATRGRRLEGLGFAHGYAHARRGVEGAYRGRTWLEPLPGMPPSRADRSAR